MKYIEDEKYKKGYLMMTSAVEMLNVAMLPLYIKKGLSIDALERKMDSTFRHASMTVREPVDAEKHFEAWELELERINSGKVTVQQLDALEGIYEFFRLHVEDCTPSDYFKIYGAPYPLVLIDDPDEKLISPVLSPEVIDILKEIGRAHV